MDGLTYWTGYQYDTASQLTQMTYPCNRVINIGHDSKGRTTSVGSYLNSVTYNSIGQMTGTTLGNGHASTVSMVASGINNSKGLFAEMTVSEFFAFAGNETSATAIYANPVYGTTLRDVYYAPGAIIASVILHETLHYFLGAATPSWRPAWGLIQSI